MTEIKRKNEPQPSNWFRRIVTGSSRKKFILTCFLGLWIARFGAAAVPIPQYDLLRASEVKPGGWIREQMKLDLRDGITGQYDRISDNVAGHLFVTRQRRAGTMVVGNRGLQEKAWWAGEHEGYWKDSIVRMAFLTGDEAFQTKARGWVEEILAAQRADGYIGIYTEDTRFPAKGFDGELWTQSRMFQAMLAFYEFTGDRRVLDAVERAVQCTLKAYRDRTYFHRPNPDGGVAHGIGYMDTLEWLIRLTGKDVYRQGALWLYRDLASQMPAFISDLLPEALADANRLWQNHTPHVMEGLHMPEIVHALAGGDLFRRAADNALIKLARHTNPGGGMVGSENVEGRIGAGDMPSEYCSLTEGAGTLNRIIAWRGALSVGAFVERLGLNAAQGARFHPANLAVVYLHFDNQMDASNPAKYRGRCLFSASHKAAACCPLNAGRLLPYYVEGMWYRDRARNGLAACQYGPCEVQTTVKNVSIRITEETDYPFSDNVRFTIQTQKPVRFPLILRIPDTAGKIAVDAGPSARVTEDRAKSELVIEKDWEGSTTVSVDFKFQVERRKQHDGHESYYQWGPLLFSLPLDVKIEKLEELTTVSGVKSGFYDYRITAVNRNGADWQIDPAAGFRVVKLAGGNSLLPWSQPPIALRGQMRNAQGQPVEATLKPYGSTILRRTTFPVFGDRQAAKSAVGVVGRTPVFTFKTPMTKGAFYVEFIWRQVAGAIGKGWSGIELTGEGIKGSFAGRPAGASVFGLAGHGQALSKRKAALSTPIKLIAKYDLDRGKVSLWIDPDITRTEATYSPDVEKKGFVAKSVQSVDIHVDSSARTEIEQLKVFMNGKTPFGD